MIYLFIRKEFSMFYLKLGHYDEKLVSWIKAFEYRKYDGETKEWVISGMDDQEFFDDLENQMIFDPRLYPIVDDSLMRHNPVFKPNVKVSRYESSRFLYVVPPVPFTVFQYINGLLPDKPIDPKKLKREDEMLLIRETYEMGKYLTHIKNILGWDVKVHKTARQVILENRSLYDTEGGFTNPLLTELYDYQKFNVNFLLRGHTMDASQTGLGKTITAMATLAVHHQRKNIQKVLIVCPKNVIESWTEKFAMFYPDVKVVALTSKIKKKDRPVLIESEFFAMVTNFEIAVKELDKKEYRNMWDAMIIDEVQRIKSWESKTAQKLKRIRPPYRWALTATPVENRPNELFSIMAWLNPSVFGTFEEFRNKYFIEIPRKVRTYDKHGNHTGHREYRELMGYQNLDELSARLSGVIVRQLYKNIKEELPEVLREIVYVESNPTQRKLNTLLSKMVRNDEVDNIATISAFRQIANDPRLVWHSGSEVSQLIRQSMPEPKEKHSFKTIKIMEVVSDILANGNKVVVFSSFVKYIKLLTEALIEEDIASVEYHGEIIDFHDDLFGDKGKSLVATEKHNRDLSLKIFNEDDDVGVLFASDALSTGYDGLQHHANYMIFADLHWNPAVNVQRVGRLRRIGQKLDVVLMVMLTHQTFDEYVHELVEEKKDIADQILSASTGASITTGLTSQEVIEKYVYGK